MNQNQWEKFLAKENPTENQWYKAKNEAMNWHSCAVGCHLELPRKLKTNGYIQPHLTKCAEKNGVAFYKAIENRDLETARKIYQRISNLKKLVTEHVRKDHSWC